MTPNQKRYALAIMTAVFTLGYVDRGVMGLLLQSIKEDLQLSDTRLGLVTGIAFGLFYAIAGIPIARLADRGNRVVLAALSIGFWGLAVMACSFVTNFVQLLFARMAAAVGEAGCKPTTYSLLGDYFPQADERTRAMSIWVCASPLSSLLSFGTAGWLNDRYGWALTFFWIGIPGLLLGLLTWLTLKDPRPAAGRQPTAAAPVRIPLKRVCQALWQLRSLRHLLMIFILVYTLGAGLYPWYAAFMIRSHGMTPGTLGLWLGLIFGLGGIVGALSGGFVANHWFAGNERAQMRMNSLAVGLLVPCFIAFLMLPGRYQALGALVPLTVMINYFLGPTYAVMQRLVAEDMRATAMSVVMLVVNVTAFGLGPQIVGILSDRLMPWVGDDSLRYAMLCLSLVTIWIAFHFWKVGTTVKEDLTRVARA